MILLWLIQFHCFLRLFLFYFLIHWFVFMYCSLFILHLVKIRTWRKIKRQWYKRHQCLHNKWLIILLKIPHLLCFCFFYTHKNILISFQLNVLKTKIFHQSFNVNICWYKWPFNGSSTKNMLMWLKLFF